MNDHKYLLLLVCLISSFQSKGQEVFVSQATYLERTNEISIKAREKKNIKLTENIADRLIEEADSIIIKEEYEIRERLPIEAYNYLDTTGYSKVYYFNSSHELLATASFIRFEYVEDALQAYFTATFAIEERKSDSPLSFDLSDYVMSNAAFQTLTKGFTSKIEETRTNLPVKLTSALNIKRTDVIDASVLDWNGPEKLHAITYGDFNTNEYQSYFVSGSSEKVLYSEASTFSFYEVRPLPLIINNYPVLLCRKGKPDTDWVWSEMMYYDGETFVSAKDDILPFISQN
ncbi:MAG: hypothetical protein Roseis2KO_39960 [Roseivirga sp.]